MTDPRLQIARHIARQRWPAIGPQTRETLVPQPVKRTRSLPPDVTVIEEYTVEIHRFLVLPQTYILMGYSDEFDELVIIDERPNAMGVRQGLLQIVDALERGPTLHISPTTSELRRAEREERKRATG